MNWSLQNSVRSLELYRWTSLACESQCCQCLCTSIRMTGGALGANLLPFHVMCMHSTVFTAALWFLAETPPITRLLTNFTTCFLQTGNIARCEDVCSMSFVTLVHYIFVHEGCTCVILICGTSHVLEMLLKLLK
jgi:hypothetical protein